MFSSSVSFPSLDLNLVYPMLRRKKAAVVLDEWVSSRENRHRDEERTGAILPALRVLGMKD